MNGLRSNYHWTRHKFTISEIYSPPRFQLLFSCWFCKIVELFLVIHKSSMCNWKITIGLKFGTRITLIWHSVFKHVQWKYLRTKHPWLTIRGVPSFGPCPSSRKSTPSLAVPTTPIEFLYHTPQTSVIYFQHLTWLYHSRLHGYGNSEESLLLFIFEILCVPKILNHKCKFEDQENNLLIYIAYFEEKVNRNEFP